MIKQEIDTPDCLHSYLVFVYLIFSHRNLLVSHHHKRKTKQSKIHLFFFQFWPPPESLFHVRKFWFFILVSFVKNKIIFFGRRAIIFLLCSQFKQIKQISLISINCWPTSIDQRSYTMWTKRLHFVGQTVNNVEKLLWLSAKNVEREKKL